MKKLEARERERKQQARLEKRRRAGVGSVGEVVRKGRRKGKEV